MGAADGDAQGSLDDYRARLDAAGAPEPVRQAVEREIGRLESTPEQSPEHGWIRTWLDTVLDVPWAVHDQERLDVEAARAILDSDHRVSTTSRTDRRAPRGSEARTSAASTGPGSGPRPTGPTPTRPRPTGARRASRRPRGAGRASSSPWSGHREWARRASASRSPAPPAGASPGSPSAVSATRRRSGGTAAPTWEPCPDGSSEPSGRPAR